MALDMRAQTLIEARWIFAILLLLAIISGFLSLWLSAFFFVTDFVHARIFS